MGTIEVFLTKIATAVLKKAAVSAGYGGIVRAWEIYSVFHSVGDAFSTVESANDCNTLGVKGLRVLSDELTQKAADALVEFGAEKFSIRQDATACRRTAELFRTCGKNAAMYDLWMESAREWASRGNHEKAQYCEEQAK